LKKMPVLTPHPVKAVGKGRLQPLHPDHQISVWRLQRQMVVIAHHHIGVQRPARSYAGLKQTPLERRLGFLRSEDVAAIVASVDHMIDRARKLQSKLARHVLPSAGRTIIVKVEGEA
jgi:hypothetical protein